MFKGAVSKCFNRAPFKYDMILNVDFKLHICKKLGCVKINISDFHKIIIKFS